MEMQKALSDSKKEHDSYKQVQGEGGRERREGGRNGGVLIAAVNSFPCCTITYHSP